ATVIRIPNHIPNNISIFSTVMNLKVAYQSAIAAIINQERIDLIHFFEWQTIPLLIPWGDILKVQKVYSTTSIQRTRNLSKSPLASGIEKLEELSLNKSDLILASSEKLSKLINENYDVKAENLEVLSFEDEI
ncbi:MAG: glycosyltransferase, partial [Spirochaetota bacterium]|nr:glycosyltransferase [Spirochaetota bacterium]